MFSFFRRKKSSDQSTSDTAQQPEVQVDEQADKQADKQSGVQPEVQPDEQPDEQRFDEQVDAQADAPDIAPEPDAAASPEQQEASPDRAEPDVADVAAATDAASEEAASHAPVDATPPAETAPSASEDAGSSAETAATASDDAISAPETASSAPGADKARESSGGSWLSRLKRGLSRTGQSIGGLFVDVKLDEDLYEELETALIMADAGMEATTALLEDLRTRVRKERLTDPMQARAALRDLITQHLKPLEKDFPLNSAKPLVMMIAGVNGAGKTTSIGKLANAFQERGAHVLLAAGDTFRAAAREQLLEWGSRNNVTVIAQEGGDPAAVAFDAVNAGRARKADVVMVDTAGRLPTQLHLMEELKKIKRVISKAEGSAPHEVVLVVDGNSGQNVLAQIRAFDAAIGLTGLVVTKLDGTAKGGILAAVAAGSQGVRPVPVYWIGVGEGIHDLQPFRAHEFAAAMIGDATS